MMHDPFGRPVLSYSCTLVLFYSIAFALISHSGTGVAKYIEVPEQGR